MHRLILLVTSFVPLGFILFYGVDIPFADEWQTMNLVHHVQEGTATWATFWTLNNEHLQLFPNLLFGAFAYTIGWHPKGLMIFSWILMWIVGIILLRRSEHQLEPNESQPLWIAAILFTFFSMAPRENWLWGFQLGFLVTHALTVLGLLVISVPRFNLAWRIAAVVFCGGVATLSSGHGLIIVPAAWVVFLLTERSAGSRWIGSGWLLGVTLFSVFFHLALLPPGVHHLGHWLELFDHPFAASRHLFLFFGLLAVPLVAWAPAEVLEPFAALIGIFLVTSFTWLSWSYRTKARLTSFWIGLGCAGLGATLLINFARVDKDPLQALVTSRYATPESLLTIATLGLAQVAWKQSEPAYRSRNGRWLAGSCGGVILLVLLNLFPTFQELSGHRRRLLLARHLLPFVRYFDPQIDGQAGGALFDLYPFRNQAVFGLFYEPYLDFGYLTPVHDARFNEISDLRISHLIIGQADPFTGVPLSGKLSRSLAGPTRRLLFVRRKGNPYFLGGTMLTPGSGFDQLRCEFHLPEISVPPKPADLEFWLYNAQSNQFLQLISGT